MKVALPLFIILFVLTAYNSKDSSVSKIQEDNDLKSIVKHLEKNFTGKMRKTPHIAKAHFSETILNNETYTGYLESIGYAIYLGENNGNVAPYTKYKFYCENTKAKLQSFPSTTSCLREVLKFRYYGPFANNKFSYKLVEQESGHSDYVTIKCVSKKVGDSNFSEISVSLNKTNLEVREVTYQTRSLFSSIYNEQLKGDVKINFVYLNGEPFVSHIKTSYKQGQLVHQTAFNLLEQELKTFDLDNDEFWSFNTYDHYPYLSYNRTQWNELGINPPDEYDKIQSDLEVSLEDYFIKNSNQWFHSPSVNELRYLEIAQNKMSELKNIFH